MPVEWIRRAILCIFIAFPGNSSANGSLEIIGLKSFPNAAVSSSVLDLLHFRVSVDFQCVKTIKGVSWFVESWMTCIMQCKCRFGDLCRHVVFNSLTMKCTVADPLAGDGGEWSLSPGDVVYTQQDPIPTCSATEGYELHQKCGAAVCLHLASVHQFYNDAAFQCRIRKGILYTVMATERSMVLRSFATSKQALSMNLWVGLRRISGSFYWETGTPLSQEQAVYLWTGVEPNNAGGNEDCAAIEAFNNIIPMLVRDQPCNYKFRFVCEQILF